MLLSTLLQTSLNRSITSFIGLGIAERAAGLFLVPVQKPTSENMFLTVMQLLPAIRTTRLITQVIFPEKQNSNGQNPEANPIPGVPDVNVDGPDSRSYQGKVVSRLLLYPGSPAPASRFQDAEIAT